jgi:hypothetical protein
VLRDLGDHAGTQAAYLRALAILERFLSPEHPDIAITQGNLAALNEQTGQYG